MFEAVAVSGADTASTYMEAQAAVAPVKTQREFQELLLKGDLLVAEAEHGIETLEQLLESKKQQLSESEIQKHETEIREHKAALRLFKAELDAYKEIYSRRYGH